MRKFYCNCCGEEWTVADNITDESEVECPNCGALYDPDNESIIESFNAEELQQKSFRCNACGTEFSEPNGVYEKLRCPTCHALKDDGAIEEIDHLPVTMLTNEECNILDQIASKSKMDCWFWIEETDEGHVIHDLEEDKRVSLKSGIEQLVEGIVEGADFYGLSENQVSVFENLLKRLEIGDSSPIFNN